MALGTLLNGRNYKNWKTKRGKREWQRTALSGLSLSCGPTRWGFYCLDEEREAHELKVLACEDSKQNSGRDALY